MRALSLSTAWEQSQLVLARDGRLLTAVALGLIVLPQTIVAVVAPGGAASASLELRLLLLADILIGFAAQIALNRLAIGPSVTVGGAIGRGFARLGPVLLALLMLSVVLGVLLVILGVGLTAAGVMAAPAAGKPPAAALVLILVIITVASAAIFQLTIPIAAAEHGGPIRLLSRSWELARSQYLRLLAFICLVFVGIVVLLLVSQFVVGSAVLLVLGAIRPASVAALAYGLLVAIVQAAFTVVTAVMLSRIYVQLAGAGEAQAGVPSSGI
jgi:hypothetical protein